MPCGKGLLTPSPNSPAKAISHMVLFGEQFFFIPQLVGIACGIISRRCMVHLAKTALGQGMCLCCCLTNPFLDWNSNCNWYGAIVLSNWSLDGFKFQASTVSVWWAMGEGGSSTIKRAWCGKDISSFSPQTTIGKCVFQDWPGLPWQHGQYQLLLANITPLIQVMVSVKSTWFSKWFLHVLLYGKKSFYISYLFSRWCLVFSKWFLVFCTWFPEFGK